MAAAPPPRSFHNSARYRVRVTHTFNARHALTFPGGTAEPSHGHDWTLTVEVGSDTLDAVDCVLDFHALEAALAGLVEPWHHGDLNTLPPFWDAVAGELALNPSAERVAEAVLEGLMPLVTAIRREARVLSVAVTEAPGCIAHVLAG